MGDKSGCVVLSVADESTTIEAVGLLDGAGSLA
jgi:hypothetical protein